MAQAQPQVQGTTYSWTSIGIKARWDTGGIDPTLFKGVSWSDALTPKDVYASGPHKAGRTTGTYECEASLTFLLDGWRAFQAALAAENESIALVEFDLIIQWTEKDVSGNDDVHEVILEGCRVAGRDNGNEQGNDESEIEIPLSVMRVSEDGVYLLAPPNN